MPNWFPQLTALQDAIRAAGIPLTSLVLADATTTPPGVNAVYDSSATPAQIASGNSLITGFDWTPAAQTQRDITQQRQTATTLLSSLEGSPKLLRAVREVLKDEINLIRAAIPRAIVSITRATNTATATCADPHGLATGDTVRIQGATLAAYNVTAVITVTSTTVFTYAVAGSPVTPAVGSISFTLGVVPTMAPRTTAQINTAILAKISSGVVDS